MVDKFTNRDAGPVSYQSSVFQAVSVEIDESPNQVISNGGAGVSSPRFRRTVVVSLEQDDRLAARSASPTSITSPEPLHRSLSHADQPIFRSASISLSELKKPLYGSVSAGGADLEAFLCSNDHWNRDDETRPRIGAKPSHCFAAEQTTAQPATAIPVLHQEHQANVRPSSPTVPHLQTRSAPDLDLGARLDDALQRFDSCGIGSLDRLRLSGRMLTSPKSFPPRGSSEKLDISTSNINVSDIFSHAAPSSNPTMGLSMQAGSAGRMRRQSSPGLQSTAVQKTSHRRSFASQSSRLGKPASKTRRLSSPAVRSAGVQKPSYRLPSSSPPKEHAGPTSATRRQSSPPRRLSLDVDLNPTLGQMSPTRSPSHQQPKHRCQTDGCNADLSDCKPYVRRYRLCWACMKSSEVLVDSKAMRFCQQCSRLHDLSMFDGKKKSCRVKLIELKQRRMAL